MTRETKVGLIVAGSFLCLVCIVVASKMRQGDVPPHDPEEQQITVAAVDPANDAKKPTELPKKDDKQTTLPARRPGESGTQPSAGVKSDVRSNGNESPGGFTPPSLSIAPASKPGDPMRPEQLLQNLIEKENNPPRPMSLPQPPTQLADVRPGAPMEQKGFGPITAPPSPFPIDASKDLGGVPLPMKPMTDSVPAPVKVVPPPAPDSFSSGKIGAVEPMPVFPKKDGAIPPPSGGAFGTPAPVTVEPTKPTPDAAPKFPMEAPNFPPMGSKEGPPSFPPISNNNPPAIKPMEVAPPVPNVIAPIVSVGEPTKPTFPEAAPTKPAFPETTPTKPAFPDAVPTKPAFPEATPTKPAFPAATPTKPAFPMETVPLSNQPSFPPITKPSGNGLESPPQPIPSIPPQGNPFNPNVPITDVVPSVGPKELKSTPPISTMPPITINGSKPVAPPTPMVKMWEQPASYICQPGESTFAALSKRFYGTEKYADALHAYNREHRGILQNGSNLVANPPLLNPGQQVINPPLGILERDYRTLIRAGEPNPIAPVVGSAPAVKLAPPAPLQTTTPLVSPANSLAANPPTADRTRSYVVQSPGGERIRDIAERFLGDANQWNRIYRLNPSYQPQFPIPAGATLRIPVN